MEPEMERIYQRLEALERTRERHSAVLDELNRRLSALEEMRNDLRRVEQSLIRVEGRLEALMGRMQVWQTLVWALLAMIIGGLVAAGFSSFGR